MYLWSRTSEIRSSSQNVPKPKQYKSTVGLLGEFFFIILDITFSSTFKDTSTLGALFSTLSSKKGRFQIVTLNIDTAKVVVKNHDKME